MDENNKINLIPNESQEEVSQIMDRLKNIQPELRNYVLGQSYANDFLNMVKNYSLAPEYVSEIEYITTMTLLGFIRPSEVKDEITQALPNVNSSVRGGIHDYIFANILTKERVAVLENNWKNDDMIEKELSDYIEMQDVPRPEGVAPAPVSRVTSDIRPSGMLSHEKVAEMNSNSIPALKSDSWEDILKSKNENQVLDRTKIETSLPKVTTGDRKNDLYREIPE